MAEDFTPSKPPFTLFVADEEGNIDFRNRDMQTGMWLKVKDTGCFLNGKLKNSNQRFLMSGNKFEPNLVVNACQQIIDWAKGLEGYDDESDW